MLETDYHIGVLCEIAGVSRSAFYRFKHRTLPVSRELEEKIIDLYRKSGGRLGYRTIKMRLKSDYRLTVNHKKIRRIMAKYGLKSVVRAKYRMQSSEEDVIRPDLLKRDFQAGKPYEKLVTDITYIPTPNKMMYLSAVIDLFDNYPVAWHVSDCQDKSLSFDTIRKLEGRADLSGTILHSDRGVHYTSKEFSALLARLGIRQSMSRKGNCWDNACAESFFSQYKCECIYLLNNRIKTPADVYAVTAEYFDYYIYRRPQKRLGGLTPYEYRRAYSTT